MSVCEEALEKNGWKETKRPDDSHSVAYANPGWPGAMVLCGGGFSIRGDYLRGIADEWDNAEKKNHRMGLGHGGEYGLLAKFLNHIGPSQELYRQRGI